MASSSVEQFALLGELLLVTLGAEDQDDDEQRGEGKRDVQPGEGRRIGRGMAESQRRGVGGDPAGDADGEHADEAGPPEAIGDAVDETLLGRRRAVMFGVEPGDRADGLFDIDREDRRRRARVGHAGSFVRGEAPARRSAPSARQPTGATKVADGRRPRAGGRIGPDVFSGRSSREGRAVAARCRVIVARGAARGTRFERAGGFRARGEPVRRGDLARRGRAGKSRGPSGLARGRDVPFARRVNAAASAFVPSTYSRDGRTRS